MKLFLKTGGWAAISGVIFFASAYASGSPLGSALCATFVAVATKTPFYPAWEWAFHKVYDRPRLTLAAEPEFHI